MKDNIKEFYWIQRGCVLRIDPPDKTYYNHYDDLMDKMVAEYMEEMEDDIFNR